MDALDDPVWKSCEEVWAQRHALPQLHGAYVVRYAPDGKPKSIARAFRADSQGILCFGRTKTRADGLKGRLTALSRALQGRRIDHSEGFRYRQLDYMHNGFPVSALQIAWLECASAGEAKHVELAWFDKYADEFGELPPLNRQRG